MAGKLIVLTHHKCATNWLRLIFGILVQEDMATLRVVGVSNEPETEGENPDRLQIILNVNSFGGERRLTEITDRPAVHFIRDPRDALVSNYWSWLKSHSNNSPVILKFREDAQNMTPEDGLLRLLRHFPMGRQLETWTSEDWDSVRQVRYEDLLQDFEATLAGMFSDTHLEMSPVLMTKIRDETSFSKITGRDAGQEDMGNHFRKGVVGDWKNYFTPRLEEAFHEHYGWLGPRLGYW